MKTFSGKPIKKRLEIISFTIFIFVNTSFSQMRLIIGGNSYLNIENQGKIVISNASSNAISSLGPGGIISESEFDQVIWHIGASVGTYNIPFVSTVGLTQIPFTCQILNGGTVILNSSPQIRFSTYPGSHWNNDQYRPSDVTHMYDLVSGTVNNSNHVIDRFWICDAQNYAVRPSCLLNFTYRDAEHLQFGNNIAEIALGAQRFNSNFNQWGDYLPQGTTDINLNRTTNVPATPQNFFRSWTLSETTNPLASNVFKVDYQCINNGVQIQWTANYNSEDIRFLLQKEISTNWETLVEVEPIGTNGLESFNYFDESSSSNHYRIISLNSNLDSILKYTFVSNCNQSEEYYSIQSDGLIIKLNAVYEGIEPIYIYDASGRLIYKSEVQLSKGSNNLHIQNVFASRGIYFIEIGTALNKKNGKVIY
jgi:hypothetical protein